MITLVDATLAVAFTDTGDTVTLNSHGFSNGDRVVFTSITTTTKTRTRTNACSVW